MQDRKLRSSYTHLEQDKRQNIIAQNFNTSLSVCLKLRRWGLSHVSVLTLNKFKVNPFSKSELVSLNTYFPIKETFPENNTI